MRSEVRNQAGGKAKKNALVPDDVPSWLCLAQIREREYQTTRSAEGGNRFLYGFTSTTSHRKNSFSHCHQFLLLEERAEEANKGDTVFKSTFLGSNDE